jgi:hypothetical protein
LGGKQQPGHKDGLEAIAILMRWVKNNPSSLHSIVMHFISLHISGCKAFAVLCCVGQVLISMYTGAQALRRALQEHMHVKDHLTPGVPAIRLLAHWNACLGSLHAGGFIACQATAWPSAQHLAYTTNATPATFEHVVIL